MIAFWVMRVPGVDRDVCVETKEASKLMHDTITPASTVVLCRGLVVGLSRARVVGASSVLACSSTQCTGRLVSVWLDSAICVELGVSDLVPGKLPKTNLCCPCSALS